MGREHVWLLPFANSIPQKMKLVKKQQAIDIHALIGNIGGYIGLFLGEHAMKFSLYLHCMLT